LLWSRWEFRKIQKFLPIKYNNLDVKRSGWNNYSIKIIDSKLKLKIWDKNTKINYFADFNWNYRLSSNKHYFYNIKIKPYIKDNSDNKNYYFNNADFKISGKIDLKNFKNDIDKIFEQIPKIQSDYIKLKNKDEIKEIVYSMRTWKIYFK
jgi:hypothetical protein